jgi:hypothetical protein
VHVTLTRVDSGVQPTDTATIVAEEMLGWLRDLEGYKGFLMLSGGGTTIGMTFWDSREAAERNSSVRKEFVERISSVAGVEIQERIELEVRFADLPGFAA